MKHHAIESGIGRRILSCSRSGAGWSSRYENGQHVLGQGDRAYLDNLLPHGAQPLGRTSALALVVTAEG